MDGMAHRENGAQGATHGNRDNQISLEQLLAAKGTNPNPANFPTIQGDSKKEITCLRQLTKQRCINDFL